MPRSFHQVYEQTRFESSESAGQSQTRDGSEEPSSVETTEGSDELTLNKRFDI